MVGIHCGLLVVKLIGLKLGLLSESLRAGKERVLWGKEYVVSRSDQPVSPDLCLWLLSAVSRLIGESTQHARICALGLTGSVLSAEHSAGPYSDFKVLHW